ncbi:MAG: hypothetical protein ACD_58C00084G0007 [uncultured bacterium]|nr:MAG: hypothetical protein ACD_58C00084G0007 [uncultured bacterium]
MSLIRLGSLGETGYKFEFCNLNLRLGNSINKFYITTTIPYVNAKPHIGHALEFVQADALARYYKQQGDEVYFLSGADENSLKNVLSAEKEGISTQKLVDKNSGAFEAMRDYLNLSFDQFFHTSGKNHFIGAQKLWSSCDKDDIYKKSYKGLYCVGCEEFKKEADLVNGKCPEHKSECEKVEEENYFFRLANYKDKLYALIKADKLKVIPETRKNEVLSFIKSGLEDFSISRSIKRAKGWGVPVPGDKNQIMYVWFDALANYITALGYGSKDDKLFKKYWPADVHVIGKGVTRFHAIYWPAMLMSAEIELPKSIFVHGYVTVEGEKISKSIGNVVDPKEVVEKFGTDALRYYLLKEISPYGDGDFSWKRLEEVYNSELANELGNLVNRVAKLTEGSKLKTKNLKDIEQEELLKIKIKELEKYMNNFQFDLAIKEIWRVVHRANEFIEEQKPWELARSTSSLENTRDRSGQAKKPEEYIQLQYVLVNLVRAINGIGVCLEPFLPETALKIQKQFAKDYFDIKSEDTLFPRIEK